MRRVDADTYRHWFGKEVPPAVLREMRDYFMTLAKIGQLFKHPDRGAVLQRLLR